MAVPASTKEDPRRDSLVRTPAGRKGYLLSVRRGVGRVEFSDGSRQSFNMSALRPWEEK